MGKTIRRQISQQTLCPGNAYFVDSHDVGLSLRSLNLLSICCVGPERQKQFKTFHKRARSERGPSLTSGLTCTLMTAQQSDDVTLHHGSVPTCSPLCNKFAGSSGDCVHHVSAGNLKNIRKVLLLKMVPFISGTNFDCQP